MSAFKIGGFAFRSWNGVFGLKKHEDKAEKKTVASTQRKTDSVELRPDRLAVMPRMSTIDRQTTQHIQGETIEAMLKDSAAELDTYFSAAYGFDGDSE